MFKIGEFSKLVRVSARMLRYYDRCGLLRPAEVDRFTGYRLYSAAQVPLLSRIVALRDMGFGVDEIGDILPHYEDADYLRRMLSKKREEINNAIVTEQGKLEKISDMSSKLEKERAKVIYEVELKKLPAVNVLSLREMIPSGDAEFELWKRIEAFTRQNDVDCDMNGYSIYYDDEHKEADLDVEIAVPVSASGRDVDGFVYRTLDAIPQAATIRFSGSYENYSAAVERLAAWMEQNGYEFAGSMRGLTITGPQSGAKTKDFMTELQIPVKKV